jgi:4-carboxymuconolactone decarboxylase
MPSPAEPTMAAGLRLWSTRSVAGIELPQDAELRDDVRELLPLIAPPGREPAATMRLLARAPELLVPFLGWAAALAFHGTLPKRDHEILALRVAHNCASTYEFWEHAAYAREAAVPEDDILGTTTNDHPWNHRDSLLVRAADELDALSTLEAPTVDALGREFDATQIVEILFVVGQYTMLSLVANAAGLAAPE